MALFQIDKLEQSEQVRTAEEERAEDKPLIFSKSIKTLW